MSLLSLLGGEPQLVHHDTWHGGEWQGHGAQRQRGRGGLCGCGLGGRGVGGRLVAGGTTEAQVTLLPGPLHGHPVTEGPFEAWGTYGEAEASGDMGGIGGGKSGPCSRR